MELRNAASIPRSEKVLGRANCLAPDAIGNVVFITGPKAANRYQVAAADPSISAKMPAAGLLIRKDTATLGVVQFHGPVKNVYAGLTPGATYYVGTDGLLSRFGDPNFPGTSAWFQKVGIATGTSELFLDFGEPSFGALGGQARFYQRDLTGAINGVNTTYLAESPFLPSGPQKEAVFRNGVLQEQGAVADYVVAESVFGGGYDTVVLVYPLRSGEKLRIDFTPDTEV
jgi:hypothetical protein